MYVVWAEVDTMMGDRIITNEKKSITIIFYFELVLAIACSDRRKSRIVSVGDTCPRV